MTDAPARARVEELRIFGDAAEFRRALKKRLVAADGLRARALALRDQVRVLPPVPHKSQKMGFVAALTRAPVLQGAFSLKSSTDAWRRTNDVVLARYLGAAAAEFRLGPVDKALVARAVQQLFAGFSSVEHALATLRNDVGTGHGRAQLPPGLRARHGQLAIDAADTYTRYIVETLRDLKLL
ncbi:abortive infection family protein [Nostocoides sp. HKS02]|uniref:abortive infection family protein n=1 Tax=Nostocoides sp. HKS02 TaxID=1813880 RepID=UPI0012B46505|nr:abortive infection family protein [Tetrasphaera sp. HKS02]QGN58857.1 hypothetical protein GKE56_14290 [Tetrasphaera sp. HKS02]